NLLNAAFAVPDGVQVVVVKDGPHILAICGDCAGPAVPTFLVFQECTRHSGCSQRFLETWWKRERPFLLVSRVRRWRRRRLWREWLLDGGLAGDIAVSVHDVVRIDETRNHEEGLAGPARFHGHDAQPAHAFAGGQTIIVKAAEWIAVGVATCTEYVEAVGLSNLAVVDRWLGAEDFLIHLEFPKVRGFVAESFQHRPHIGNVRVQSRHVGVLHLIEHMMKLGWPAGEERCSRW